MDLILKNILLVWNQNSSFIIQVESIQAVNNIEKLLSFDEVDGVMVGPYDISGSLGFPGQTDHPKVIEASKKVITACEKYSKVVELKLLTLMKKI